MSYIWSLIGLMFSVSQDVFAGEEQLGTATAVIEEASPLSATLHDFHRDSEMK